MDNFEALSVWRFTDGEFKRFKQVAVLGLRKRRETEPPDTLWLEQYAVSPASIPSISDLPEHRYALPAYPLEVTTFMGERFNQKELEQQLKRSNSFQQLMARSELDNDVKRPPLPALHRADRPCGRLRYDQRARPVQFSTRHKGTHCQSDPDGDGGKIQR